MIIVENKFKTGVISRIKYVEGLDMLPNISYAILTKEDYEYYLECSNMCKLEWVDEEHILSKFC